MTHLPPTIFIGTTGFTAGDQVRFPKATHASNRTRAYTVLDVTGTEVLVCTDLSGGEMSEPYRFTHDEFRGLEPELLAMAPEVRGERA